MPDFTDRDFPANPYPGARPEGSFVHLDQSGWRLKPNRDQPSGWGMKNSDLGAALEEMGAPSIQDRLPVLAYGSNANPSKITWLRNELGLAGPVVVIRARCKDIAAVWSAGKRARDGQRPAVLAALPGSVEHHTIWLATPEQRRVLDECEGRGQRYRLSWLRADIQLENGAQPTCVLAYTARPEALGKNVEEHSNRSPLLVAGELVPCSSVTQEAAVELTGSPAEGDGLDVVEVTGEP